MPCDQPHRPGPLRSEGRGESSGSSRENRRARAACVVTWWPQPARDRTRGPTAPALLVVLAIRDHGRRSAPPRPAARGPSAQTPGGRARALTSASPSRPQRPSPSSSNQSQWTEPASLSLRTAALPAPPRPSSPASKPRLSHKSRPQGEGGPWRPGARRCPHPSRRGPPASTRVPHRRAGSRHTPTPSPRPDPPQSAGRAPQGNCPLPPPTAGPQGTLSRSPEPWPAPAKGRAEPELVPKAARQAAGTFSRAEALAWDSREGTAEWRGRGRAARGHSGTAASSSPPGPICPAGRRPQFSVGPASYTPPTAAWRRGCSLVDAPVIPATALTPAAPVPVPSLTPLPQGCRPRPRRLSPGSTGTPRLSSCSTSLVAPTPRWLNPAQGHFPISCEASPPQSRVLISPLPDASSLGRPD